MKTPSRIVCALALRVALTSACVIPQVVEGQAAPINAPDVDRSRHASPATSGGRLSYLNDLATLLEILDSQSSEWRAQNADLEGELRQRSWQLQDTTFSPAATDLQWLNTVRADLEAATGAPAPRTRAVKKKRMLRARTPAHRTRSFGLSPLADLFRAPLKDLQSAPAGFGRYAYLVSTKMPNPSDPRDYSALAIKAIVEHIVAPARDLAPVDLGRYGITYIPTTEQIAPGDDWKLWASGYALGLASRIRAQACMRECEGRGPWLVVTRASISDQPIGAVSVLNLASASTPSMVEHWVRHFEVLMRAGHEWSTQGEPNRSTMWMRNELARLGGFVLDVAGTVISVRKAFAEGEPDK